jgi:hypothetical protein
MSVWSHSLPNTLGARWARFPEWPEKCGRDSRRSGPAGDIPIAERFNKGAKVGLSAGAKRRSRVTVTTFHLLIANATAHEPPIKVCFNGKSRHQN